MRAKGWTAAALLALADVGCGGPRRRWPAMLAAIALLGSLDGCGARPQPVAQDVVPDCVRYWGEARYHYPGFDHVVHVVNGCEKPVRCEVSTSVDREVIEVRLSAGQHIALVTRRSSPTREFTPHVDCTLMSTSG